ncbi:MAG: hypothetical protein ACTSXQ_06985 [Alphaproteobacteria bacterium]
MSEFKDKDDAIKQIKVVGTSLEEEMATFTSIAGKLATISLHERAELESEARKLSCELSERVDLLEAAEEFLDSSFKSIQTIKRHPLIVEYYKNNRILQRLPRSQKFTPKKEVKQNTYIGELAYLGGKPLKAIEYKRFSPRRTTQK